MLNFVRTIYDFLPKAYTLASPSTNISQEFEEVKEKIRLLTCEVAECGVSLDLLDIKCRNIAVANSCLDVRVCANFWKAAQTCSTSKGRSQKIKMEI